MLSPSDDVRFFPFDLSGWERWLVRPFGVRPDRDGVVIENGDLIATFGPLHLRTPLINISEATVTGPYRRIKAVGPRLSMADHGLTFGTANRGVCLTFRQPVDSVIGPWSHPGLTVTVADPAGFVDAIQEAATHAEQRLSTRTERPEPTTFDDWPEPEPPDPPMRHQETAGPLQQLLRTLQRPATAVGPAITLGRRAIDGSFWAEDVRITERVAPVVEMSDAGEMQSADDGAGTLNRRRYRIVIAYAGLSASELMDTFCSDPNRFSPTEYAAFDPAPGPDGLQVGDRITVELPGPWDGPVLVTERSDHHVRFETRDGHMEAGWIEFRAADVGSNLCFEIESLARSGDAVFDALYHRIGLGKLVQTDMWVRVLEEAGPVSGGSQLGRVLVETTIYAGSEPCTDRDEEARS